MLIRTVPLLLAVTLACLHASAAQKVFSQRRFVSAAAADDSAARGRPPPAASKAPAAAANAIAAPPPPPPPPPALRSQPAEPVLAPQRFGAQQRAPAPTSAPTSPRPPPPSPPPPPARFRLPEQQQEEAVPVVQQRQGQQYRVRTSATTAAPPPPPPPPPPTPPRSQPAEVVPTHHRFAHERSAAKPVPPPPAPQPQQPARKVTPDVVSLSKSEAALQEERQRQAESAQYSFGSSVQDSIHDNSQSRHETRDGLKTAGHYSYSDGYYRRTVHYEADDKGYRVVREETETIGDGPQLNPDGRADVESHVGGIHSKYSVTLEDIPKQQS